MLVRDVGEFHLIDTLAKTIADGGGDNLDRLDAHGFRLRLSIGDDAAAWDAPQGVRILTTDTMVEGVHFDLGRASWRDLGWRSIAVNLSDVAAMGCAPTYSVVTLGIREDLPVDGLVDMYRGMLDAHREFGGAIAGGDVVRSPTFFVSVALAGTATAPEKGGAPGAPLLTRHSASPGDEIAVMGSLGCSAGGLRMMMEGLEFDLETANHLRDAHNRPMPRISQGVTLAKNGVASAIDISDGLVDDLGKLCKASGVGAVVRMNQLPADGFLKAAFPEDWPTLALGGGEDYELLFTAPRHLMNKVTPMLDIEVSVIGEIVRGAPEVTVLDSQGNRMSVDRRGWDHFAMA